MNNKTTISIDDDFDLFKIMNSGQAFRIREMQNGYYRFISGDHILYIRPADVSATGIGTYEAVFFNASEAAGKDSSAPAALVPLGKAEAKKEWEGFWKSYFDLERNYSAIRKMVPENDTYMRAACENGKGLRILRQDPWEMIITFIISQRKSIPAIKDSVERICGKYGRKVSTGFEETVLFPSCEDMESAGEDELKDCKLGYRVSYIQDAVRRACSKDPDPYSLYDLDYPALFEKLKEIRGVGDKVSNCVCLFACSKTEAAPVDTWISKVIEQKYTGVNPFPSYGDVAGIMQQYIFYYALTHKDSL